MDENTAATIEYLARNETLELDLRVPGIKAPWASF